MKHKIKLYVNFELTLDLEFDRQVELYIDRPDIVDSDSLKILMLLEPDEISHLSKFAMANYKLFNYILTHDKKILKRCPNAVLFEFGSCWVNDYEFKEKEFGASTIVGHKKKTKGHLLRQELWYKQKEIKIPTKFFISQHGGVENFNNNPVLGARKNPAFDTQFHIAIENVKKDYWFTEKLIDCFRTKTVPIYWGCPHIGNYFNTRGMIIVCNIRGIIRAVNSLTSKIYETIKDAVEENYQRAEEYIDFKKRLENKLKELVCR